MKINPVHHPVHMNKIMKRICGRRMVAKILEKIRNGRNVWNNNTMYSVKRINNPQNIDLTVEFE